VFHPWIVVAETPSAIFSTRVGTTRGGALVPCARLEAASTTGVSIPTTASRMLRRSATREA
jgi:hypothetical protein